MLRTRNNGTSGKQRDLDERPRRRKSDQPRSKLRLYVLSVVAAGGACAALAYLSDPESVRSAFSHPATWLLMVMILGGELLPVRIPGQEGEETLSTTFVFALLLIGGLPIALLSQLVASLIADLSQRKSLDKLTFNLGQLSISWYALGAVLFAANGEPVLGELVFSLPELAAILAGALAFFAVNSTLVRVVEGLALELPIVPHIFSGIWQRAWAAGMLLGLALPVAVVSHTDPVLVPFIILPMAAIHLAVRQSAEMEYRAFHDLLTGLPNRALFNQAAAEAIEVANLERRHVGIVLFDIDGFKEINDTLGHQRGDEVLKEVAARASSAIREGDTAARFGGDEFGFVFPDLTSMKELTELIERVRDELTVPIEMENLTLVVDVSLGAAVYPDHGAEPEILIRRADSAVYRAKHALAGYELYRRGDDRIARRRLELVGDLRTALSADRIGIHVQPKLSSDGSEMVGVEALARWDHPERGAVSPAEFIPIAEQSGLITELTATILYRALELCSAWQKAGRSLEVAVNLSMPSMLDVTFPKLVEEMLEERNLDPACLTLELTESVLMADLKRARHVTERLSRGGIKLAIDDFGQGYSSLAYLARLKVAELKLDKQFVQSMRSSSVDAAIVQAVINLGRDLGIGVVAEGVETPEQHQALVALGCPFVQGYLFARPMEPAALARWHREKFGSRGSQTGEAGSRSEQPVTNMRMQPAAEGVFAR